MCAPSIYGQRWSPVDSLSGSTVLDYSAGSHVGLVRTVNEDAFMAGPPVFVVADGMGGYARGDVASTIVVEAFEPLVGQVEVAVTDLDAAIARSRDEIARLDAAADAPGSTVIVAAYVTQSSHGYWLIAHEGDSRAYTWRNGRLDQITRDHSIVQEMVDAGEIAPHEAHSHPERHVITRAVGARIDTEPEFTLVPVESGSRLLLCTDGLTTELSADSIAVLLGEAKTSRDAVDTLLRAAVDAGGHDNVTVLVVDVLAAHGEVREDTLRPGDMAREDTIRIIRRLL